MLSKGGAALSKQHVDRLLDSQDRPGWLARLTTIDHLGAGYDISVDILAWGVQRMLRNLLSDARQASRAEETARRLLAPAA